MRRSTSREAGQAFVCRQEEAAPLLPAEYLLLPKQAVLYLLEPN